MSYGLLAARPELHTNWPHKVAFTGKPPKTRPEEYDFVLNNLGPSQFVLDAACGWHPHWHILPELMADNAYFVLAMDGNAEMLYNFPPQPQVVRMMGDICGMPFANQQFPTVICISVLEHLPPSYQYRAFNELIRVTQDRLIITADASNPETMAQFVEARGFDAGEEINQEGDPLQNKENTPVAYLVATR
jgi:hypothetical protein